MKKVLIIVLIILAIAYLIFSGGKNDDKYFNKYFSAMIESGETKEADKFMDNFSLRYHDENGFNYIAIKNIVKNLFEKFEDIEASFSNLTSSISKDGDGKEIAVVNIDVNTVVINGGIKSDLLGVRNTPENITIYLEKSTFGSWKIFKVEGLENRNY